MPAQAIAKQIKLSQLCEIVIGNDVSVAVHDTERIVLWAADEMKSQHRELTAADALLLAAALETLTGIETLTIRGNQDITGGVGPPVAREHGGEMEGWDAICNVLKDVNMLPLMTSLDLSNCGLNEVALATLAPALGRSDGSHGLQALEELNLSNNDALMGKELDRKLLGAVDVGSLKAANVPWIYGYELEGWNEMLVALSFSKVKTLAVENCHLSDTAFKILATRITAIPKLDTLSIWRNKLSLPSAEHLCKALWHREVQDQVKIGTLIFGSDPKLRPVRSGDDTPRCVRTYSLDTERLDFSPPMPERGSDPPSRKGWGTNELGQARIKGGVAKQLPTGEQPEWGDALLLVAAIATSSDFAGTLLRPAGSSKLRTLDLRGIPLAYQAKVMLGEEVIRHSQLKWFACELSCKDHVFDASNEDLLLSHKHCSKSLQPEDLYVIAAWLAHNPRTDDAKIRGHEGSNVYCTTLDLSFNDDIVGVDAAFRHDLPSKSQIEPWQRLCDALRGSPVASLLLDETGLGHPHAVSPLGRALQEMRYVKACSVEGNPIARSELKLLESRQNGGPMPLTYELYR
eukprot:COSAG04_NODE_70_length_29153_cov_152.225683_3_plen_574_part_00